MALAASGIVLAGAIVVWARADDGEGTTTTNTADPFDLVDWVGPKSSLDGLVSESELVVVGRFTAVGQVVIVDPNGYDPNHLRPGTAAGIPFTDLVFQVDEYLKGSGPATLTVTQTGDLQTTAGPPEFPKPTLKETQMLFLTSQPGREQVWASHRGPFGRVKVTGGKLVFATGEPREVQFLAGMSFEQAKQAIRAKTP